MSGGGQVLVLDSENPVVIMPNKLSEIKEVPEANEENEISIKTNDDTNNELDKIQTLLEKSKPKRDDGIELIINNDEETQKSGDENESGNSDETSSKKIINI